MSHAVKFPTSEFHELNENLLTILSRKIRKFKSEEQIRGRRLIERN